MRALDSKAVVIVGFVGTESPLCKITPPKGFLTQQKLTFHACKLEASILPIGTETQAFLEFICLPEQCTHGE